MPPNFPHQIQGAVLWSRPEPTGLTPTGLSPSLAGLSRPLRLRPGGLLGGASHPGRDPLTPHPPGGFPQGFGLGSSPFARRYSGNPIFGFFSSPYLDASFRGVPAPCRERPDEPKPIRAGGPIRVSPDPRLHTATRGLSQPATPFLGARAEPSTRRVGVPGLLRRPHLGCCPRPLRGGHSERELGWAHAPFALHPTSQMLGGCIQPRP